MLGFRGRPQFTERPKPPISSVQKPLESSIPVQKPSTSPSNIQPRTLEFPTTVASITPEAPSTSPESRIKEVDTTPEATLRANIRGIKRELRNPFLSDAQKKALRRQLRYYESES